MTRLVWITDPHLNFENPYGGAHGFGLELAAECACDGVVITGDIAEAASLRGCLESFTEAVDKPVYFVLGNHDYYGSSFVEVHEDVGSWAFGDLVWLTNSPPITIAPGVRICGVEGWYDGRAGNFERSNIRLRDQRNIVDFAPLHPLARLEQMRKIALVHARIAETMLREAALGAKTVIFATHVPPFPGATWHQGSLSDANWLPWMCNVTMGETLLRIAEDHPEVNFLVLCGHTHSYGQYAPLPNLLVRTGRSEYGKPQVSGVLEFP